MSWDDTDNRPSSLHEYRTFTVNLIISSQPFFKHKIPFYKFEAFPKSSLHIFNCSELSRRWVRLPFLVFSRSNDFLCGVSIIWHSPLPWTANAFAVLIFVFHKKIRVVQIWIFSSRDLTISSVISPSPVNGCESARTDVNSYCFWRLW